MMILLDTNVLSELMREEPDKKVKQWIGSLKPGRLVFSTISIAEIQRGLARLPNGRCRKRFELSFSAFIGKGHAGLPRGRLETAEGEWGVN